MTNVSLVVDPLLTDEVTGSGTVDIADFVDPMLMLFTSFARVTKLIGVVWLKMELVSFFLIGVVAKFVSGLKVVKGFVSTFGTVARFVSTLGLVGG